MRSLLLPLFASVWLSAACTDVSSQDSRIPLRFGLFAASAVESREQLAVRYQPFVTYLEANLARPIELVASNDAGRMLADFEAGRFDVALNRAFAFPHAHEHVEAIPLVTSREERQATSVFLASADDHRQSLQDFLGARLNFSVRLGSSHVMGLYYLEQQRIDPQTFFREVHYSNVADEAIERLRHGQTELCVANSQALARMFASGFLRPTEIKIVAETPPHAGQLWFASRALSEDDRLRVRNAFLALSTEDPAQAAILSVLGASAYLPATHDDYRQLTELMRRMQLLEIEASQVP